jgi:hypothetical protein
VVKTHRATALEKRMAKTLEMALQKRVVKTLEKRD